MAILFISNLVPDRPPYNGSGFARSGNNALLGIGQSLPDEENPILISCRPVSSFPKGPIWFKGETVKLDSGREVKILPTLNLKVIKNLFWAFQLKRIIKRWTKEEKNSSKNVLVYNIYTPPISKLYKICKKRSAKLFAILYDLGVPVASLNLSWISRLGFKAMEKVAYKYLPLLDGRIIINEKMIEKYAPGKDYVLIDGGVNNQVISRLFPLVEKENGERLILTLAGWLWEENGTKLLLNCMEENPDLEVEVYFAGNGQDVELIERNAEYDGRIHYAGMLDPDALFKLYEKSDVLLNLRVAEEDNTQFPSKLLEYMATGKHVISTSIAHAERDYGEYITVLPESTPKALARVIRQILKTDSKILKERGEKARKFMLENRNWETRTKEIVDYIKAHNA